MEGLEELALSIALDIEPHDPPKGMGERLFAKIEAPRSRPASIVALPAAKAGAKVGKFKLATGIWAKGAAVAGAVLLVASSATLYENQSSTGTGSAPHSQPTKNAGAGVARADKTQQSNHAPTAIAKHDKQTKPTNKAKTNVAQHEVAYNNKRNDSVKGNGGASGSEESRGDHSASSNAGNHGNHGNHDNSSNHGSRVNHGGRSKQGNQSGRGKPDNQDNQDNQGNQDDQGKQSIPAPAPDRAPNRMIEVGLNSGKTSIHIDVFRN